MSDLSESNVRAGKIAVGTGMVDQGTVDRAIHLLEARDSQISLGELLLSLGHITQDQFKELMQLAHAAAPKPSPNATMDESRLFGEAVVERGLATPDQVNEALREQAELAGRGTFKNLGELLIAKKVISPDQVKDLLHEQDQQIMVCATCGEKYNVLKGWQGKAKCPADGTLLSEVQKHSSVGVGHPRRHGRHARLAHR